MLTDLTRLGDSFGIRIPVALLEQIGFGDEAELVAEKNRLIIQPERKVSRCWEEALAYLAECVDDAVALGEIPDLPHRKA